MPFITCIDHYVQPSYINNCTSFRDKSFWMQHPQSSELSPFHNIAQLKKMVNRITKCGINIFLMKPIHNLDTLYFLKQTITTYLRPYIFDAQVQYHLTGELSAGH